jgi:hypothetical protein
MAIDESRNDRERCVLGPPGRGITGEGNTTKSIWMPSAFAVDNRALIGANDNQSTQNLSQNEIQTDRTAQSLPS